MIILYYKLIYLDIKDIEILHIGTKFTMMRWNKHEIDIHIINYVNNDVTYIVCT